MINNQKILCVIPARKNSKGLKNKNIRKINNKPLIYFPINSAKKSKYIDRIVFSSDSLQYNKLAKKFGTKFDFLRPKKLANNKTLTFDVLKHSIEFLKRKGHIYDIILCLEPTSPFTTSNDIDMALETFIKKKAQSLVSVFEANKYSDDFQFKKRFNFLNAIKKTNNHKRRQEIKNNFILDGSIYISKINNYLKNKSFISNKTLGYEMPKWKSFEIDDNLDFLIAKYLYKLNLNEKKNY